MLFLISSSYIKAGKPLNHPNVPPELGLNAPYLVANDGQWFLFLFNLIWGVSGLEVWDVAMSSFCSPRNISCTNDGWKDGAKLPAAVLAPTETPNKAKDAG